MIYGVAITAFCMLVGNTIGESIGKLLGLDINVGGVGFAMILLLVATNCLQKKEWLAQPWDKGIIFWKNMYIPIVVAMSAGQNVVSAINHGLAAVLAGLGAVVATFGLVWLLFRKKTIY